MVQRILSRISLSLPNLVSAVREYAQEQSPRRPPTLMIILVLNTSQNLDPLIEELTRYRITLKTIDPSIDVRFMFYNLPRLLPVEAVKP
jgi:hypothetical protein